MVMEKNKDGRKFPVFTMILGVFICFFMLSAVIYSNVQQLQINNEITEKQKELRALLAADPCPGRETLKALDRAYIAENLSPGGSADLLGLCWLLHFLKEDH